MRNTEPTTTIIDMSKAKDAEMLARAKVEVDLPGWFAARGWLPDPENDSVLYRNLKGPDGDHVIISRARDQHWRYYRTSDGQGGTIFDAAAMYGGARSKGQQYAACRHALAAPTPAPSVIHAAKSHTVSSARRVPLGLLNEAGRSYLHTERCLSMTTIERFAHALRAVGQLGVVACHNPTGGEERGPDHRRFGGGNSAHGEGLGRSLWLAVADKSTRPTRLLIAESFVDALSAWEMLPTELQSLTALASTGGSLCPRTLSKLEQVLARVPGIQLLDASDQGEVSTARRIAQLKATTEAAGGVYSRLAPPAECKDWNDALAARLASQVAEAAALLPLAEEEEAYTL